MRWGKLSMKFKSYKMIKKIWKLIQKNAMKKTVI